MNKFPHQFQSISRQQLLGVETTHELIPGDWLVFNFQKVKTIQLHLLLQQNETQNNIKGEIQ